jgi:predicted enzyme related to lactoylglutathione lyase
MGERTSHAPGTISWADLATSDQEGAKAFYSALFGWEFEDMPAGEGVVYSMARLRGKYAAAVSPQQQAEAAQGVPPHWNVYVTVEDVDATTGKAGEGGGQVFAEPFDVFDAGRMAVIADPGGAALCLWQPGRHIGAEIVNVPGAFTWADTAAPDPQTAQAFYSGLFGWRFEPMSEEPPYWVIFNGDRSQGGMTVPPPEVPPNWFPYFAVEDVEASMKAAEGAGGTPFAGPIDIPNGGRFAHIQHPQGAAFALFAGEFDE